MKKILIAGIGNIFHGDDAFGCEVIRELEAVAFPEYVERRDFGIRGYDLAYALTSDYEAIILVDATSRGKKPGTLYLIEPDVNRPGEFEKAAVDAHSLNPVSVIQMAQSLGGIKGKLYLVGCEPAVLECADGQMGLSAPVQAAMPRALEMTATLVRNFCRQRKYSRLGGHLVKGNYERNMDRPGSDRGNSRPGDHHHDPGTAPVFQNP